MTVLLHLAPPACPHVELPPYPPQSRNSSTVPLASWLYPHHHPFPSCIHQAQTPHRPQSSQRKSVQPLIGNAQGEEKGAGGTSTLCMPNDTSAAAQSNTCQKRVELGVTGRVNRRKFNIHRRRRAQSGEEEQHGQA